MFIYKDYNYISYILNLPYKQARKHYIDCLGRFTDIDKKTMEDRLFQCWLIDTNEEKGDFEKYKKAHMKKQQENTKKVDDDIDAEKEYLRISTNINKIIELDKKRREDEKRRKIKN